MSKPPDDVASSKPTSQPDQSGGPATSFHQLCRDVAGRFLQTVVVVDDEAEYGDTPLTPGPLRVPDVAARRRAGEDTESEYIESTTAHSMVGVSETDSEPIQMENAEVDAKQLVDAFARLQLVCAIIKPIRDEQRLLDNLLAIARRSDLLVLDWNLEGDSGATTRELIEGILRKDHESGGRLRLICVYTGRQDLEVVQDQLAEDLEAFGLEKDTIQGRFRLGNKSCRIVILAKPNISLPEHSQVSVVPLHLLPERLLDEFTELTAGLMPGLALECLSALRDNAHNLLRSFHAGLDIPFLSHRLLAQDPETFAVTLVANEMQAVLEETEVQAVLSNEHVQAWAHEHFAQGNTPYLKRNKGVLHEVDPAWVKELLSAPEDAVREAYSPDGKQLGSVNLLRVPSLAELFAGSTHDPTALEHEFARLSSLSRSISHQFLGSKPPVLRLGTVVTVLSVPDMYIPVRTSNRVRGMLNRQIDALPQVGTFWLSLQPDCDSVRLDEARKFPMAPLTEVEASDALSGGKFDLVALSFDGKPLYFRTSTRPYQLRMATFGPSESVIRATKSNPGPIFTDADGVKWLWIAQLRYAHALRLANSLGRAVARVGLDESEWLRRHS
jgi:hypothetical protein